MAGATINRFVTQQQYIANKFFVIIFYAMFSRVWYTLDLPSSWYMVIIYRKLAISRIFTKTMNFDDHFFVSGLGLRSRYKVKVPWTAEHILICIKKLFEGLVILADDLDDNIRFQTSINSEEICVILPIGFFWFNIFLTIFNYLTKEKTLSNVRRWKNIWTRYWKWVLWFCHKKWK